MDSDEAEAHWETVFFVQAVVSEPDSEGRKKVIEKFKQLEQNPNFPTWRKRWDDIDLLKN